MDFGMLLLDLLITVFVYLLVPVIIALSGKPRTKGEIRTISIVNGIGGYLVFLFIYLLAGGGRIPNVAAAFLWSAVGRGIMNKVLSKEDLEDRKHVRQVCAKCGYSGEYKTACPECGSYARKEIPLNPPARESEPAAAASRFCPQCGTPNTAGGNFCPNCGERLS